MSRPRERVASILVAEPGAAAPVFGPGSTAALDNEAVVQMVARGVPEREILKAIEDAEKVSFDLEPDVIRELESVGVSQKVLTAMRRRQGEAAETLQPQTPAAPRAS